MLQKEVAVSIQYLLAFQYVFTYVNPVKLNSSALLWEKNVYK